MIILDTNVLSELVRARPLPQTVDWLDRQAPSTLYLTAITVAEMREGIAILPDGRRRDRLRVAVDALLTTRFRQHVLPFDEGSATQFAALRAQARAAGRSVAGFDGLIAAIALQHRMIVATRDTAPFLAAGVQVIDPFAPAAGPGPG